MTEEQLKELEIKLRAELKKHDWYYDYSDDGNVWRRGRDHRNRIGLLFKTYKEKAGTDRAHALWNECAPKDFQIVEKGGAS